MVLRSRAATWFEILTPREHLADALAVLSRTGAIELQAHTHITTQSAVPNLTQGLAEFRECSRQFASHWPEPVRAAGAAARDPGAMLVDALERLHQWIAAARPLIDAIEQSTQRRVALEHVAELLERGRDEVPSPQEVGRAGPLLDALLFVLDPQPKLQAIPDGVLVQYVRAPDRTYALAVGARAAVEQMSRLWSADQTHVSRVPSNLPADPLAAVTSIRASIEQETQTLATLRAQLEALAREHQLATALGDLAFLEWFSTNVPALPATEHFAWITGWSDDNACVQVKRALETANVPYLLHMPGCPSGLQPPLLLRNPAWARPFEFFTKLAGMPGEREADPSVLVALLAPLMFGLMFGDIGQGAVLLIAGLLLRKRWPMLNLLIPGGFAAIVFGALFGSVFAREDLIEPLWLAPLEAPLMLLGLTLGIGACIVLLGLAINALQAVWSGRGLHWLAGRAGILLLYVCLIACVVDRRLLFGIPLGAIWFIAGEALTEPRGQRLAHAGKAAGELIETSLQLIVNTLSFLRVGAFALAHAGLSVAIVGLAEASDSVIGSAIVLVIGNVFVLVLEALVVGIQTTRLVLFEFFVRFLEGTGRPFRPLPPTNMRDTSNHSGDVQ